MNRIWFIMIVGSICFLLWSDPSNVLSVMIDASGEAFSLCIELCAVYAVWLGVLELVEESGLGKKLAKLLHPLIKKLFKIDDQETEKMIALNMSANMLGLGNAATPMGIAAMKRLDDGSGIATPAMIMLIVINATSIQLLPSTVIGLRTAAGSVSPSDIILPTLIATTCTCALGITLVSICNKIRQKRHRPGSNPPPSTSQHSTNTNQQTACISNKRKVFKLFGSSQDGHSKPQNDDKDGGEK